jgi:hypothetical protein
MGVYSRQVDGKLKWEIMDSSYSGQEINGLAVLGGVNFASTAYGIKKTFEGTANKEPYSDTSYVQLLEDIDYNLYLVSPGYDSFYDEREARSFAFIFQR